MLDYNREKNYLIIMLAMSKKSKRLEIEYVLNSGYHTLFIPVMTIVVTNLTKNSQCMI